MSNPRRSQRLANLDQSPPPSPLKIKADTDDAASTSKKTRPNDAPELTANVTSRSQSRAATESKEQHEKLTEQESKQDAKAVRAGSGSDSDLEVVGSVVAPSRQTNPNLIYTFEPIRSIIFRDAIPLPVFRRQRLTPSLITSMPALFRQLDADEIHECSTIWANPADKKPLNIFGLLSITLKHLQPKEWLSDNVILEYLRLIESYTLASTGKRICVIDLLFTQVIATSDSMATAYPRLKANSPLNADLVLFPIHHKEHWTLACVDPAATTITYYDSFKEDSEHGCVLSAVFACLSAEWTATFGKSLDQKDWRFSTESCPQQKNDVDCGVFMLLNALFLSLKQPLTYAQSDIGFVRKSMMRQLINRSLLLM